MWSLPHTESKPSSSHRSAVGRMSEGFAKGTGYIMPSMHVGMWTPNLMQRGSRRLTGGPRATAAARRAISAELLRRVGLADGQGDGDVEARLDEGREPPPRVIGGAGEREGVDLVLGDEGGSRLAARPRRADGERLGLARRRPRPGSSGRADARGSARGAAARIGARRCRRGRSRRARRRGRGKGPARMAGAPARSCRARGARERART